MHTVLHSVLVPHGKGRFGGRNPHFSAMLPTAKLLGPQLYLALKNQHSFYHLTKCKQLSQPMHCSKGMQPMRTAVYHSVMINTQLPTVEYDPRTPHTIL